MEREVSTATWMAISLTILAVLITIIFTTVNIGQSVEQNSSAGLNGVGNSLSLDYVMGLTDGEVNPNMPAATAYNILSTYSSVITYEATGWDSQVRNLQTQGSELSQHLQGRVLLDIVETPEDTYVAFVHILNSQNQVADLTTAGFTKLDTIFNLPS